tara:strand:- start:333 stop:536 length:204 start_codon:yes stop_codon:yes gene_type:complete
MSSPISVSTKSDVRQNSSSQENQSKLNDDFANYPEEAEKANGRWAMLGFIALIGAYATTGQIIPGIF